MIDFRSDTVTQPTKGMLAAMQRPPLGDDVFGEDSLTNALELETAQRFGFEAGLFCPSGTMANQIAIKNHSSAPGSLICDQRAHVYLYEVGGISFHSGLTPILTNDEAGLMQPESLLKALPNPQDLHKAAAQLLVLENTCNKGGGSCYELDQMQQLSQLARTQGLAVHLDGARIANAIVAKGYSEKEVGACFDSISICLSKGLGAPIGSLLLGSSSFIRSARRLRKLFGGGMRQTGQLAAAGQYALAQQWDRLAEDHEKAAQLGDLLEKQGYCEELIPIQTNIVLFRLRDELSPQAFLDQLAAKGLFAVSFGGQWIRLVTHLDISATDMQLARKILTSSF